MDGSHADNRDQQQRSSTRRVGGSHADNRDQQQRLAVRRLWGSHDDNRDEQQRSKKRRLEGYVVDRRPSGGKDSWAFAGNQVEKTAAGKQKSPGPPRSCASCGVLQLLTAPVSNFDLEKDKCGYCLRCGAASKFEQFRPNEEATPLDELTFVEEMSISIELPLMYLSTLSPGGQLGYKAHTTVAPQDVGALAKTLPWGKEKLKNHQCIIRQGGVSGSAGQGGAKNCRDF